MSWRNPLKGRQKGQSGRGSALYSQDHQTLVPHGTSGFDFQACVNGLMNNPNLTDDDLITLMGSDRGQNASSLSPTIKEDYIKAVRNEVKRRNLAQQKPQGPPRPDQQTSTHLGASLTRTGASDRLELVNYSPEELVKQVDERIATIQFGWTKTIKWMEGWSEFWSWSGPIILLLGTIGEVFMVLWLRQKAQEILAGISIVAVAFVLEGTFLTVSYKSATIRGRAERRPGGPNALDKKKMKKQMFFWFCLATGVCASQIIFVVAQTRDDGIGAFGVWAFAILRSVFTLVADGYTAFAHEEKPTTDERALEEQQQRAKAVKEQLEQSRENVKIFNEGILAVRESVNEAEIKDVKQRARLETEKLQADQQVSALRQQNELAAMMTGTFTKMITAMIDPSVSEEERQHSFKLMQAFSTARQQDGQIKQITEEHL